MVEKFLTTEQVAAALQLHPFTILKLIKTKKLQAIKIGKMYRIKENDLNKFLEASAKSISAKEAKPEPLKHAPPSKPADNQAGRKPEGAKKTNSEKDHFIIE